MTPYYDADGITLYLGDCREVMADLDLTADLLVTDPPYGQDYFSNFAKKPRIVGDDGSLDVLACIAQACSLLRRSRHAYIFGRWDLSGTPLTAQAELVWDKVLIGMGDLSQPWGLSHEPITFASHFPSKANASSGRGRLSARMRQGTVLRVPRPHAGGAVRHPTEKPVALLRQLIESSSCFGEVVFDPFAGVGSTLVAAALEGRRAVGIEVEERYCAAVVQRLTCPHPVRATRARPRRTRACAHHDDLDCFRAEELRSVSFDYSDEEKP